MNSIKKQLVSGTLFLAAAKYSGVCINLLLTAILARILIPEQFAIVAITSVLSNFFNLFSDFGFAAAIIQRNDLDDKNHNDIFSFSAYIGIALSAIFFFSSYIFVEIYSIGILGTLVKLLAIQVLFTSLNIVPGALLSKAKEFRFIAIRTLTISIIAGICAVLYAFAYRSIYSLIIPPIMTAVLLFAANFIKVKKLRFTFFPSWTSVKKVLSYSTYNLGYNIINYISRNLDKLIIGKLLPMKELAYYEKSYTLMLFPVMNIISVVNPVIHPVLSEYQNDNSYIYRYFCAMLRVFAWIGFPLSVILATFGNEIIHILLGGDWKNAIPIFQIFSLSIGFQIVYVLQGPFFLVRNAPRAMFLCGILTAALNTTALLLGVFIFHSTTMIAWFIDISYVITTIMTFYWLYRVGFDSKYREFWYNILPPLLFSAAYIGIVFIANRMLPYTMAIVSKYAVSAIFLLFSVIRVKRLFVSTR